MTLLVQITDTHVVERGTLLYGMADTARHLAEAVSQINSMRPQPDLVLITGAVMTALVALTVDWIAALIEKTLRPKGL